MDKKKLERTDVANEPVDLDDEGIVDTGVLYEDEEEGEDKSERAAD